MWVEFVVGSRRCSETFLPGTPVFSSPQKPPFSNSNSIWIIARLSELQFDLDYFQARVIVWLG